MQAFGRKARSISQQFFFCWGNFQDGHFATTNNNNTTSKKKRGVILSASSEKMDRVLVWKGKERKKKNNITTHDRKTREMQDLHWCKKLAGPFFFSFFFFNSFVRTYGSPPPLSRPTELVSSFLKATLPPSQYLSLSSWLTKKKKGKKRGKSFVDKNVKGFSTLKNYLKRLRNRNEKKKKKKNNNRTRLMQGLDIRES